MSLITEEKWVQMEKDFSWDDDPLVFIFHKEQPEKVKMMTHRLNMKNWIQIDKTYPAQMKLRHKLIKENYKEVFVTNEDEGIKAAKQELLEMIIDYLPKQFSDKFESRDGGVYNKIVDEFVSSDPEDVTDPLIRAGNLTQEDWCILEWSESHQAYVLTAGIVYFPMRWSLLEKWNQPMSGIHEPVEAFTKHLSPKVHDLFKNSLTPNAPIWRANWAVFNDLEGPLDLFTPDGHDKRNEANKTNDYQGEATGKALTFRAEYQTLIKLPKSKAIVFSIRTYQRYLEDFKNYPSSDANGLVRAIENLVPEMYVYKGAEFWKEAALTYLRNDVLKINQDNTCLKMRIHQRRA